MQINHFFSTNENNFDKKDIYLHETDIFVFNIETAKFIHLADRIQVLNDKIHLLVEYILMINIDPIHLSDF